MSTKLNVICFMQKHMTPLTFFYLLGKKTCNSHFKCRRRCTGIYKCFDEIFKVKKGQWYLQKWSDETAKTILKSSYDLVISFGEFPLQMNEELCMTDIQHEPNPLKKKKKVYYVFNPDHYIGIVIANTTLLYK
jgi:hypothetical protein